MSVRRQEVWEAWSPVMLFGSVPVGILAVSMLMAGNQWWHFIVATVAFWVTFLCIVLGARGMLRQSAARQARFAAMEILRDAEDVQRTPHSSANTDDTDAGKEA